MTNSVGPDQTRLLQKSDLGLHCFVQTGLSENLGSLQLDEPHDKTNKMSVGPSKTQLSLGFPQSDQSLCCALNG